MQDNVFSFLFSSKCLSFSWDFLTHLSFRSILFNFQTFWIVQPSFYYWFLVLFLYALRTYFVWFLFVLLHLLRCVLCTRIWSILVNGPCVLLLLDGVFCIFWLEQIDWSAVQVIWILNWFSAYLICLLFRRCWSLQLFLLSVLLVFASYL